MDGCPPSSYLPCPVYVPTCLVLHPCLHLAHQSPHPLKQRGDPPRGAASQCVQWEVRFLWFGSASLPRTRQPRAAPTPRQQNVDSTGPSSSSPSGCCPHPRLCPFKLSGRGRCPCYHLTILFSFTPQVSPLALSSIRLLADARVACFSTRKSFDTRNRLFLGPLLTPIKPGTWGQILVRASRVAF